MRSHVRLGALVSCVAIVSAACSSAGSDPVRGAIDVDALRVDCIPTVHSTCGGGGTPTPHPLPPRVEYLYVSELTAGAVTIAWTQENGAGTTTALMGTTLTPPATYATGAGILAAKPVYDTSPTTASGVTARFATTGCTMYWYAIYDGTGALVTWSQLATPATIVQAPTITGVDLKTGAWSFHIVADGPFEGELTIDATEDAPMHGQYPVLARSYGDFVYETWVGAAMGYIMPTLGIPYFAHAVVTPQTCGAPSPPTAFTAELPATPVADAGAPPPPQDAGATGHDAGPDPLAGTVGHVCAAGKCAQPGDGGFYVYCSNMNVCTGCGRTDVFGGPQDHTNCCPSTSLDASDWCIAPGASCVASTCVVVQEP